MKETTKELIEWIKESLPKGFPNYRQEAIYFLDSLPEIESHLCRGGYIQDRNGTPCCDEDKVNFQYGEGFYNGTLIFDPTLRCFTIVAENGVFFWTNGAIEWFEKVE